MRTLMRLKLADIGKAIRSLNYEQKADKARI